MLKCCFLIIEIAHNHKTPYTLLVEVLASVFQWSFTAWVLARIFPVYLKKRRKKKSIYCPAHYCVSVGVNSSVNYFRSMRPGSTTDILCSLSCCVCPGFKNLVPPLFPHYPVMCAGCHPCPSSLSQHVLICVFVGPCTLQARLSSGQPLFFALARDFSGLLFLTAADSFPTLVCCCMVENEGWKEFHFGCGYLCMWAQIENRSLQLEKMEDKPTHLAEGWLVRRNVKTYDIMCLLIHIKVSVVSESTGSRVEIVV